MNKRMTRGAYNVAVYSPGHTWEVPAGGLGLAARVSRVPGRGQPDEGHDPQGRQPPALRQAHRRTRWAARAAQYGAK